MIAYNRTSLDNMTIRQQADEAFAAGCITPEENTRIGAAYPIGFYTPNIFICFGLFLLTALIAACSLGLILLIQTGSSGSLTADLIFFGLVCYGALEFVVHKLRHFRSGVDYALLWMSAGLLYAALCLSDNVSAPAQCVIIFSISLLFTIRFANNLMALVVYAALLAFIVTIAAELSRTVQMVTPFLIMAISVAGWFLCARLYSVEDCRHYRQCLTVIKTATLISFYLAGNTFIVGELSSYMLGASGQSGGGISMGWLFWILTVAIPFIYLYRGIREKDPIFLWTGLALIAVTVFTVRHFYSVMPVEWAMMLGGLVMITLAYGLIRYLRTPRHGFTSLESSNKHVLENLHIESLVIAETFAGPPAAPATHDFDFGGGSSGGGGAGGEY
jgi:uncharacterized membrane protein YgcG